jgi:hypothetical protein
MGGGESHLDVYRKIMRSIIYVAADYVVNQYELATGRVNKKFEFLLAALGIGNLNFVVVAESL